MDVHNIEVRANAKDGADEAPNEDASHAAHREAHGLVADDFYEEAQEGS